MTIIGSMRVQVADNGWPGIFIPGDSAVFDAPILRLMADGLVNGTFSVEIAAGWLRELADGLEACKASERTDVVDRVAKAIQQAIHPSEPLEAWELHDAARAAIAALRFRINSR